MRKIKKYITKESIIIVLVILASAIISSLFMFEDNLYNGVDTKYHMSRMMGITNSWKQGDLLAFIHTDTTGYGYAMGFFYSNLFFIIPSIMYMLGMDIILVYKIIIIACSILTAVSMYICTKKITKSKYSAIISTVLYTMCSYKIITVLVKSFVGELLSFIFIPIIILGLHQLIFEDEKKWWIFAVGFIGILNSNLVMTEIMIVISVIIIVCNIKTIIKDKKRLKGFIKATIISLLITAVFWMPTIEQLCKSSLLLVTKKSIYNPTKWLIEFKDIFWGTIQYKENYASAYGLGIIFVIIMTLRTRIKENDKTIKFCDICILTGLLLIISMTNFFPWKYLPSVGEMIQFPSRIEVPIAAFLSIACGIICNHISKDRKKVKIAIFIFIFIWQTVSYFICYNSCIQALIKYNIVGTIEEAAISEDFEYNICDGLYLPEGAKYSLELIEIPETQYETNNPELEYTYKKEGLQITLNYAKNQKIDSYMEVPLHYYHGYIAKSNIEDKEYKIEKGETGKIRIYLGDREQDEIKIYYKMTKIQIISTIITIVTLVSLGIYIISKNRRK